MSKTIKLVLEFEPEHYNAILSIMKKFDIDSELNAINKALAFTLITYKPLLDQHSNLCAKIAFMKTKLDLLDDIARSFVDSSTVPYKHFYDDSVLESYEVT